MNNDRYINRLFVHPEWMHNAPCKGQTAVFYPEQHGGNARRQGDPARAICNTCPHTLRCLEFALDNNEEHGIWGGKSRRQRMEIARNRRTMGWRTGRLRQVEREGAA